MHGGGHPLPAGNNMVMSDGDRQGRGPCVTWVYRVQCVAEMLGLKYLCVYNSDPDERLPLLLQV